MSKESFDQKETDPKMKALLERGFLDATDLTDDVIRDPLDMVDIFDPNELDVATEKAAAPESTE